MTSSESGPSARAVPTYCSWSGGKDSALALHHALGEGAEPGLLVTMLTEGGERSRSHGLRRELLEAQAASIGVPIAFAAATQLRHAFAFQSEDCASLRTHRNL